MSNYAIKTNLKKATGVDRSAFSKKTVFASLKSNVDKFDDIEKFKNSRNTWSNLKTKTDKLGIDNIVPVSINWLCKKWYC